MSCLFQASLQRAGAALSQLQFDVARRVPRGQRGLENKPLSSGKGMVSASGW